MGVHEGWVFIGVEKSCASPKVYRQETVYNANGIETFSEKTLQSEKLALKRTN